MAAPQSSSKVLEDAERLRVDQAIKLTRCRLKRILADACDAGILGAPEELSEMHSSYPLPWHLVARAIQVRNIGQGIFLGARSTQLLLRVARQALV